MHGTDTAASLWHQRLIHNVVALSLPVGLENELDLHLPTRSTALSTHTHTQTHNTHTLVHTHTHTHNTHTCAETPTIAPRFAKDTAGNKAAVAATAARGQAARDQGKEARTGEHWRNNSSFRWPTGGSRGQGGALAGRSTTY